MIKKRHLEIKSLLTESLCEKQGSYLIEEIMNRFPSIKELVEVSEQELVKICGIHRFNIKEHFICLYLNTKNCVIHKETIFIGSLNASIVRPVSVIVETLNVASGTLVGGATGTAIGTLVLPGAGTAIGYILGDSAGISVATKSKSRRVIN
ncbi:hypothetical protein BK141_08900 [Paenibacillus sp. FSL R5-0765]|uniref:JAB domain-containing protein n=1 Tax=unclassified Paenibacillus TaxID=185978 RepID=UPI00096E7DB7|nr:hypothetical protein BK141_08900 [Paenibacillus sp. FSL R5-0765]